MVTVNMIGLDKAVSDLIGKLSAIQQGKVTKIVASSMAGVVRTRIHEKGLDASGNAFGDYSEDYQRTRKKNNRTGSKIILALTGELERDFGLSQEDPIKTTGGWGIGLVNDTSRDDGDKNSDLVNYLEDKYGDIWSLTDKEKAMAIKIAKAETIKLLKT